MMAKRKPAPASVPVDVHNHVGHDGPQPFDRQVYPVPAAAKGPQ